MRNLNQEVVKNLKPVGQLMRDTHASPVRMHFAGTAKGAALAAICYWSGAAMGEEVSHR